MKMFKPYFSYIRVKVVKKVPHTSPVGSPQKLSGCLLLWVLFIFIWIFFLYIHTHIYIYIYIYIYIFGSFCSEWVNHIFLKKKTTKTLQININKTHSNKNNLTQPLRTTNKMVESAWASMGHFLCHLDPDIRKIRLECLDLKILKRKHSGL